LKGKIKLRPLKGFRDLTGGYVKIRQRFIEEARKISEIYGFEEVVTPTVEPYELYAAKSGEEIVHRMYEFKDLGGRHVVLRPEVTASIARLVAEKYRGRPLPIKLFYVANVFRFDEPQRGRYREFTQIGYEIVGSRYPEADVEILDISRRLFEKFNLKYEFKMGHEGVLRGLLRKGGCNESTINKILGYLDRREYGKARRLMEKNIREEVSSVVWKLLNLRGYDWREILESSEKLISFSEDAEKAIENLREIVEMAYSSGFREGTIYLDLGFARGLEYYTGMIFEVYLEGLNIAVDGGGRYDELCEIFGYDVPAVGCAVGVDRVMLKLEEALKLEEPKEVMVIAVGEKNVKKAIEISKIFRDRGIRTLMDLMRRRVRAGMTYALKRGVRYIVYVGDKEILGNYITIRDTKTRKEGKIQIDKLEKWLKETEMS